ncbi:MAG: HDOD domain-containing protein [Congregibacter sp.]
MSWFKSKGDNQSKPDQGGSGSSVAARSHESDLTEGPGESDEVSAEADRRSASKPPDELANLFLVMEEHLNEVELDDVREIVDALKQPPGLIDRIAGGLDDPDTQKEVILSSPSLSASVLRTVNSAAFALRASISSIEHAVTYLGTNMVKGLVLQASMNDRMEFTSEQQRASYLRLWRSSYVSSAVAEQYATILDLEQPSVYATRALLANIGALALISHRPELAGIYAPETTLVDRVAAEQDAVMANTTVISSMLARQWSLPEDLFDALKHALTPMSWTPEQNERSEMQQRDDVLIYLATRVGDAVAFGALQDVTQFEVLGEGAPEFFYLPEYLRRYDLGGLLPALQQQATARRITRLIETFGDC